MDKLGRHLTDAQYEILTQFRSNLSDILTPFDTDPVLLKWLRARNFNLRKAMELFREAYNFKKVYELDILVDTYKKPEVAAKYEFASFLGYAKDRSPIRYVALGRGDSLGFIMSMSGYDIGLYSSCIMEQDIRLLKSEKHKTGQEINEVTYIFDMEGFSIQEFAYKSVLETGLDLSRVVQDYYPEIWGYVFFINAPFYFDKVFNLFKPILRLNLLEKIQVTPRDATAEVLLKYIDADVLPAFLGGNKVGFNGDPMCRDFIKFGGKIPEKYYISNRTPLLPTDLGVSSVLVPARSVYNYSVVVRKPGSKILIEFRTEGGSIQLGMMYRKFGPDPKDLDIPAIDEYLDYKDEEKYRVQLVSPVMRLQSHLAAVDSSCKAPNPGIYIFKFDNMNSWFSSRHLIFRIQVAAHES